MDFAPLSNPLIYFLFIIGAIVIMIAYYSKESYFAIIPATAFLVYFSYNGYIHSYIWIVVLVTVSFYTAYNIIQGVSNK